MASLAWALSQPYRPSNCEAVRFSHLRQKLDSPAACMLPRFGHPWSPPHVMSRRKTSRQKAVPTLDYTFEESNRKPLASSLSMADETSIQQDMY